MRQWGPLSGGDGDVVVCVCAGEAQPGEEDETAPLGRDTACCPMLRCML